MARRRRRSSYGAGARYGGWAPYVPAAERRRHAARKVVALKKKGVEVDPIVIEGRLIARSFWGRAWCDNLERYSDYENRLPRGRTYARNGSVLHLSIGKGRVDALVQGSETYEVEVKVEPVASRRWRHLVGRCAGQIDSLVELLKGRFSKAVMEVMCEPGQGLFPAPREIAFACSCPDWASMCKHVAAVLYGVGARFDHEPAHLFELRAVDPTELLASAVDGDLIAGDAAETGAVFEGDLAGVFGIDLDLADTAGTPEPAPAAAPKTRKRRAPTARPKEAAAKKAKSATAASKTRVRAQDQEAETVTRAELLAAGVPRSTVSAWLYYGVLEKTGERSVYKHTAESRERLAERA